MAILPKEQVTQRAHRTMVTFDASHADDANSEVVWEAETIMDVTEGLPDTTLVTAFDAEDHGDRDAIDARLAADPTWEPA